MECKSLQDQTRDCGQVFHSKTTRRAPKSARALFLPASPTLNTGGERITADSPIGPRLKIPHKCLTPILLCRWILGTTATNESLSPDQHLRNECNDRTFM